jgi:hypothetical protein
MGLVDSFRRGRSDGADPQGERRNGNRLIVGDKTGPASIGEALLELVALVVAELKRRDEDLSKTSESVAADDSHDSAGSHDGATVETDKETREPERSKKN